MKKISLFSLFIAFGFRVLPDATISVENYAADKPILDSPGKPYDGDLFCELLANGMSIKQFYISKADFGFFDVGVCIVPGIADNATVTLTLRAATYDFNGYGDTKSPIGSVTWTQATGSWNPVALPLTPATGPSLELPESLVFFQEIKHLEMNCSIRLDTRAEQKIQICWSSSFLSVAVAGTYHSYAVYAADEIGGQWLKVTEIPETYTKNYYEFRDQSNLKKRFYKMKEIHRSYF